MIVELIHNAHPFNGGPKKIVDTFSISIIQQLTYKINEVDETYCNIMFVIHKGERDSIHPIEVKTKHIDNLMDDCRMIYKKISQLLDKDERSSYLVIDYTQEKLNMSERTL